MDWFSAPMILTFVFIVLMDMKSRRIENEMYDKYNIRTWHYGYFKHRKMMKALNEEDKALYKRTCKKYSRYQLYAFLFIIVYCVTVGIIRTKLGYSK